LLKFEVAKIFLHDVWHGHAQRRREILCPHPLLLLRVLQQVHDALGKALSASRGIKLDSHLFPLRHLPEVRQISGNHWYAVGAGQVSHTAAARGRRIGHDCNSRALK
jgi:hypothetical protein